MSTSPLTIALSSAARATEQDQRACLHNDPLLYQSARDAYAVCVVHFSHLLDACNTETAGAITNRIANYQARINAIDQWLAKYHAVRTRNSTRTHRNYHTNGTTDGTPDITPTLTPTHTFVHANSNTNTSDSLTTTPNNNSNSVQRQLEQLCTTFPFLTLIPRSDCSWHDVVGLNGAKQVLMEATTLIESMQARISASHSWRCILLYGASGSGKTYLSTILASETRRPVLRIRVPELVGAIAASNESVLTRVFQEARVEGGVVFYFDDIELLFEADQPEYTDHYRALRRAQAAFLRQFDDITPPSVVVVCAQMPWCLPEGFVRRLQKRVYCDLPDAKERAQFLHARLRGVRHDVTAEQLEGIATECEGYSFSDLCILVDDAKMEAIRVVHAARFFRKTNLGRFVACDQDDIGATAMKYTDIEGDMVELQPVGCLEFELALDRIRASVRKESLAKHEEFTKAFGQRGE